VTFTKSSECTGRASTALKTDFVILARGLQGKRLFSC
jgi:hypothetical protein